MKVDEKQICRLCLDVADNEFNEIDEITSEMLEVLLLEMDWNIIENSMICRTCMAIIKRSFYFKSACIHAEKLVTYFAVNKETKLEMKDIVHSKRGTEMVIEENFRCRFCMNCVKENSLVFLHTLIEETFYKKMLSVFMPEMDFSSVKNPGVCNHCREHLERYLMFLRTFLETENKLYACCRHKSSNGSRRIKLGDVLHFLHNGNMTQSNKIKWKSDELDGVYSCKLMKYEEILDIEDDQVSLNEESDIKTDMAMNKSHHRNTVNKVIEKSTKCTNVRVYKRALKDKDGSEVGMYQCSYCPYKSAWKSTLKRHTLVHKDVSEIEMYKCGLCTYATKYKSALHEHTLIHKDTSEVDMLKCSLCLYKTKWRSSFKNHMRIHKDASKVNMYEYKCSHCTYEAKFKDNLRRHMLVHKDISEVIIYSCELCSFETKYKRSLQLHALIHKDPSEIRMYKCSLCPYKTKRKTHLKKHGVSHKDASELEMYKCALCEFETKYKNSLMKHVHRFHRVSQK